MLLAAELRAKGGRRGGGIRECHRPPSSPRALFVHTENLNTPPSPTFHNRLSAPLLFFDRLINALKTFSSLLLLPLAPCCLKRFPPFFFCRREKKIPSPSPQSPPFPPHSATTLPGGFSPPPTFLFVLWHSVGGRRVGAIDRTTTKAEEEEADLVRF